jgi:hypothetical protein
MEQFTTTTPATDAGNPTAGTPSKQVAVCDDGTLIPLTYEQDRENFLERGPTLTVQLGRDDIAFVCSERFAERWPTRESIIEHVAKHRIAQREAEAREVRA